MYLRKLEIKGFGKIEKWSNDLTSGVNVIYGQNESGKSTIQAFISAMFYGLKGGRTGKDGELPPLKRYKPWQGTNYSGYLEYELDNGEVIRIGRDFENNSLKVFDRSFNDITDSFNTSKDKRLLLAEKHLGLNDACFERTVFIRQMGTRVQDGSKELLNRLSNVYQTGLEDVSLKKAEEAIKNAIKRYVGTDRTTTRPLDRINCRLEELDAERKALMEKRKQLFEFEEQLRLKKQEEALLKNKKQVLEILKNAAQLRGESAASFHVKQELEHIANMLSGLYEQQSSMESGVEEHKSMLESLSAFSDAEQEDVEALSRDYSRITALESYIEKLGKDINEKEEELVKAHKCLEAVNAFEGVPEDIEKKVTELNHEIDDLKLNCNKKPLEDLDKKIEQLSRSTEKAKAFSIVSTGLAAIFLVLGLTGWAPGFLISLPAVIILFGAVFYFIRESKAGSEYVKYKRALKMDLDNKTSRLNEKLSELSEIYSKAGVQGYEEFFKQRASSNTWTSAVISLNSQLGKLENELTSVDRQVQTTKNSISERLFAAGLTSDNTNLEEKIKKFRDNLNSFKNHEAQLKLTGERLEDIKVAIEVQLSAALRITQKRYLDRTDIISDIKNIEKQLDSINKDIQRLIKDADNLWGKPGFHLFLETYGLNTFENAANDRCNKLNMDYEELNASINDLMLQIKETETIIKGLDADDDRLQRIEEEFSKLCEDRRELEIKGGALKLGLDILTETGREIQKDYAPALNLRMSEIIPKITMDRYVNLRADSDLNLKAMVPETGDILSAASFSGGTIDQMYLAMRLALADIISAGEEKLPVIMDEAFSQYDDARTKQTISFLKEEADKRQIIIFTCKSREVELFTEVCGKGMNLITI